MSQSILAPFQLLELNVISAQDLAPISRSMRTYAIAWVHPDRKLSTRVDTQGHNNPTWNDKFVFRVDEDFLHEDTSAVMIEIYALHWFKDVHVGTVRVLVGNLIPTPAKPHHHNPHLGMRFVALQVRRPSGRPQGILNIGVALLHSSMRSMPLYSQLSTSAVGYKTLMGEEDPHRSSQTHHAGSQATTYSKPELRRSKSDSSSMFGSELRATEFKNKGKNGKAGSMVNGSEVSIKKNKKGRLSKASSIIGGSEIIIRKSKDKKGKSSSLLSASDMSYKKGKPSSILGASDVNSSVAPPKYGKDRKGKPSSVLSASEVSVQDPQKKGNSSNGKPASSMPSASEPEDRPRRNPASHKPSPKFNLAENYGSTPGRKSAPRAGKSPFYKLQSPYEQYATPRKSNIMPVPFITESELGPSPSEVAAAIAKERLDQDAESSVVVGAWNEEDSVEGLQSKLERWRTELPPVYDRGEFSSFPSSDERHERRHSDGGSGLFSCFSNICGIECSIVCGSGDSDSKTRKKNGSKSGGKVPRSPSAGNLSYM
ncbi:PREDICTED: C2 [Prunus dulcis]|uniref:PREDICTED: C2 n=1 Tax=Prunus dulcis TaxID=3755 RepID=A0A5E4G9I1_PRUDU|nr:uncharacterized protein LOC117616604 [Prunus dulcis]VVA36495.1 PREDICTED: C2 [Prunus dulcis]